MKSAQPLGLILQKAVISCVSTNTSMFEDTNCVFPALHTSWCMDSSVQHSLLDL